MKTAWLRAGALALPLLALATALPAPVRAQAGPPELDEIRFRGNEAFPEDSLSRAIVNRETHCRTFFFEILLLCPLGIDFAFETHHLNRRELPRDMARLQVYYYQRGWREAAVDTSLTFLDPGHVELTFHIDEGRPTLIDSIAVIGGEELEDPSLLEDLPVDVGDPLSGIRLDATRDTLVRRLRDAGYARADVLRSLFVPRGSYEASVTFDVAPGPLAHFGTVEITGNVELSDRVIRRMLPFREGDVYSRQAIVQGQRNLFNLGIIRYANIAEDSLADVPDSVVPLTVTVSEGDPRRVRAAVGWSTAECLNSEARWTSRNFFGGARRLQVRGRVSNVLAGPVSSFCPQAGTPPFSDLNWLVSTDFNQPWLFSPRYSLSAGLFAERSSLPDIFVRRAVGANVAVTRTLGPATAMSLFYRPQLSTLDEAGDVFLCTTFLVCNPEDIEIFEGANWLSPVGVNVSRDRTNDILNPTRGYSALADVEYAAGFTGSNFTYLRTVAEGKYYHGFSGGTVLATRLRGGWIGLEEFTELGGPREFVHPQKRFYAGGSNSVRGFPENRLGPKVLTVDVRRLVVPPAEGEAAPCTPTEVLDLTCDPDESGELDDRAFLPRPIGGSVVLEGNVETRFRVIGERFEGAVFLDFGQVWSDASAMSFSDVELSPGVGIRYFSPIGPLRMDVGYRLSGVENLRFVTSQIRPYVSELDEPSECLATREVGGATECDFPWVRIDELAVFPAVVQFNEGGAFSLNRLQLHISIGQAF